MLGDDNVVVEEGRDLLKPRGIVHAIWNPTDIKAIVVELLSPGRS